MPCIKGLGVRMGALFVAAVMLMHGAGPARAQVALDLRDADLRSFVQIVSEATGRNFVLDPQVRGNVTVIAPEEMTADALYEVFLNVLELNRLTVVDGEEADRIVPMNVARELASGDAAEGADGGYETRVIEVANVPPAEIIDVVRPLLPAEAIITPVPGANLLILSDRSRNHRRIEDLIKRLDQPRNQPIEMIRLRNADAGDIMQVVQSMNIVPEGASITIDRRSNALLISGPEVLREQVRVLASRLDKQRDVMASHVHVLNYAEAAILADVVLRSVTNVENAGDQNIRIVPETQTNALLISAPEDRMSEILAMVKFLDKRPQQVLVEGVIFEMTMDGFSDLSTQFAGVVNNAIVGGVQFSLEGRPSLTSLISAANNGDTLSPGDGGLVGGGNISGGNGFLGFITALTSTTSTRILSTPSIMTLNNQEAEIVVAQNVPFVTGSFTSTGGSTLPENPFQTIERQDVGLTLKVTPQINADKTVRLDIEQEVSNLTQQASLSGGEITAKRSLTTSVLVRDSNVIMLGGLLENGSGAVSKKVPGVAEIPLLGNLFRGKNSQKEQSILLVMLRPRVVDSDAMAKALATEYAQGARDASLALRPADSEKYPYTPEGAFPFDGNNLNQPFEAGFIDDAAKSRKLPPLPPRLQLNDYR